MSDEKQGWFAQLRQGLARTSASLTGNVASVLTKRKLDEETLDELEEGAIKAARAPAMAGRVREELSHSRHEKGIAPEAVREVLATEIFKVLQQVAKPLELSAARPNVILIVGVNGTGKTTTAAKLANNFMREGHSVLLAAGDTFRAAAIDQLELWGGRIGVEGLANDGGDEPCVGAYCV